MRRTETKTLARRLAGLTAFASCPVRDLTDLAGRARHSTVPAGWPLIQEDTPGDACYIILEGSARIEVGGETVATVEPGAVVGELALARGRLRNATVTASTPLELLHLDAHEFGALLDRRPAIRRALLARMDAAAATA